jgi:hypothetical protein
MRIFMIMMTFDVIWTIFYIDFLSLIVTIQRLRVVYANVIVPHPICIPFRATTVVVQALGIPAQPEPYP